MIRDLEIQQVKQRFGIIGNAPALTRAISRAMQIAPFDISVLITGESGTGKEFFPQIIHANSIRKHNKYIAVNCGAIPEGTIDSELFGHEKGSFTGALTDRKGYFEEGNGGTIFLDEVGELPMTTQARLLRVLENGEFLKVGSSKVMKTNVRIVAATNINMAKAIAEGKFREDLFYRLNTVHIELPPLCQRVDDILLLFRKFSADFAEKYRMPAIQLSNEAKELLTSYSWPGNIRQLRNITEQISIFEQAREVSSDILASYIPIHTGENLPALNNRDFLSASNEKEMLYKIIFEMRKEIDELKLLTKQSGAQQYIGGEIITQHNSEIMPTVITNTNLNNNFDSVETVIAENIEDKSISLEDAEREMIKKSLERNNGKRKKCAEELKISERTLYRKIKEYNLE